MTRLLAGVDRRQLKAVLAVWGFLFLLASAGLLLLNWNALRIIQWLEYVEAPRFSKVQVLYREAEKNAAVALGDEFTSGSASAADPKLSSAISLLNRGLALDPRPEFSPEFEPHFTLLGDLYGTAGSAALQLVAYGRGALARGDVAVAEKYARRAAEAPPGDQLEAELLLAQVYRKTNRTAEARAVLERITQRGNVPADALAAFAQVLHQEGNAEAAVDYYTRAVQAAPSQVNIRKQLANLLVGIGKPERALLVFQEGLESGWDDGNYLHLYGDLLHAQGRTAEAVAILTQAAKVEVSSGDIQLSLARAYEKLGKRRYANRHLQRAIALKPELQGAVLSQ